MVLQKTAKDVLSSDDILKYISDYETREVSHLNDLWEYYRGRNVKISSRKTPDPNNPDNKIIVSYARKIITTWTGYGYRPGYITYKPNIKKDAEEIKEEILDVETKTLPIEKQYVNELQTIFNANNEHIKTNRAGRNTGIFGLSYEICYIDSLNTPLDKELPIKAMPRFFTVDPREMIVLYDYSPEPKIKIGIRFYQMDNANTYKVEVYYTNKVVIYTRSRKENSNQWILQLESEHINFFDTIPVVAYYLGDEIQSIFEAALSLIDAYDVLFSDSMNEFDRFAFAYMLMKKISLTNPIDKKDPFKLSEALKQLKRRRVFEGMDKDSDVKFLTKDIPTAFIKHIGDQLHDQIHTQTHVPDFNQMTGTLTGAAIDRLLFDFENLVSSAEADFNIGLNDRIVLITQILKKLKRPNGTIDMITISHKRNKPQNIKEFADTSLVMANAGYSRRAIVGIMPEDVIPDVEKELLYEKQEQEDLLSNNFESVGMPEEKLVEEEPKPEEEE